MCCCYTIATTILVSSWQIAPEWTTSWSRPRFLLPRLRPHPARRPLQVIKDTLDADQRQQQQQGLAANVILSRPLLSLCVYIETTTVGTTTTNAIGIHTSAPDDVIVFHFALHTHPLICRRQKRWSARYKRIIIIAMAFNWIESIG